jgi:hypothetical protein
VVRDGLPRHAHGQGEPPRHLAQVRPEARELRFAGGGRPDLVLAYQDEMALLGWFERLLSARVPLGRDHRIDGPAERAARLIEAGTLQGELVDLGWRGPGAWTLREWWPGVVEWCEAPAEAFARLDFDPVEPGTPPAG